MPRYLIVIDTPGIKQFVFGTDAVAEIRGASALLDRLNRTETATVLRESLQSGQVHTVFANGGSAQFVVEGVDETAVQRAIAQLSARYHERTGGEVRILVAAVEWPGEAQNTYRRALDNAFWALHLQRNLGCGYAAVPTLPFVLEWQSSSHLPAVGVYRWGGEQFLLSEACRRKRDESRRPARGTLWSGWMERLGLPGAWQDRDDQLRYLHLEAIGQHSRRPGYIGLVYADGNGMGRLVQELDTPELYRAFSELVDGSLREACYQALAHVCPREVAEARGALEAGREPQPLPADILLLGGDDLVVLVPADRALDFAIRVTHEFQQRTQCQIASLPDDHRRFFAARGLSEHGLTLCCGVALGRARYPFYLLFELAEQLLHSAKQEGSADPARTDSWAPSYIDFHLVTGSGSAELAGIRKEDYRVGTDCPRTLRPYPRERLVCLREAARRLSQADVPRSKLHELFEAALEKRPATAELRAQELFGRLRETADRHERRALWEALGMLGPLDPFPWTRAGGRCATALADVVEAVDLFTSEEA